MRDQAAINEKIRQRALERKANGTLKVPEGFRKGFDPRRKLFTRSEQNKGNIAYAANCQKKYESTPFEQLSIRQKRRRVLEEQRYRCQSCTNDKWMGQDITLELDHINGNKKDNCRENLRCLCPNCHAQTNT